MHELLLDVLLKQAEPVSVEALTRRLGMGTEGVLRELEDLRRAGCELTSDPHRGVRLARSGLGAWEDYLRWRDGRAGKRIIAVYEQTSTTQDVAWQLVRSSGAAADGALITADRQTAGRGRLGRRWIAPSGSGVLLTRVCMRKAEQDSALVNRLVLSAAVATAHVVEETTGLRSPEVEIKWPNDVLIRGKKAAGILVELRDGAAIVGVGMNVALDPAVLVEELGEQAQRITSLWAEGARMDRLLVLAELVKALDWAIEEADLSELLAQWRARSAMLGRAIHLRCDGRDYRGEVLDLDPLEGLIVRTTEGAIAHLPAATTTVVI